MSNQSYYAATSFSFYPKESGERIIYKANEKVDVSQMSEKEIKSFIDIGKLRKTSFDSLSQEKEYTSIASKYSSILSELESSSSKDSIIQNSKVRIYELYGINDILESKDQEIKDFNKIEIAELKNTQAKVQQKLSDEIAELKNTQAKVQQKLSDEIAELKIKLAEKTAALKKSEDAASKLSKDNAKLMSDLDKATK